MFGQEIDPLRLRRVLGAFVTGVTVVTATDGAGRPRGLTVNSFTSVSLDPPLVLVCIDRSSSSHDALVKTRHFGISILSEEQRALATRFATRSEDKFADVATSWSREGTPLLPGAAAWLECRLHDQSVMGDHTILIGRVVDLGVESMRPLAYCSGSFISLAPELMLGSTSTNSTVSIVWIVEVDGSLVLRRIGAADGGSFSLPTTDLPAGLLDDEHLQCAALEELGIGVDVHFLYAVYSDATMNRITLAYRAVADRADDLTAGLEAVGMGSVPVEKIRGRDLAGMVRRYILERELSRFGVYSGTSKGGVIAQLSDPVAEDSRKYALRFGDARRSAIAE